MYCCILDEVISTNRSRKIVKWSNTPLGSTVIAFDDKSLSKPKKKKTRQNKHKNSKRECLQLGLLLTFLLIKNTNVFRWQIVNTPPSRHTLFHSLPTFAISKTVCYQKEVSTAFSPLSLGIFSISLSQKFQY